jgi:L-threonylcarbamoyladenylate synthase
MLLSHYAPRKPLLLGNIENLLKLHEGKRIAVLSYQRDYNADTQVILSPVGSKDEAAKNLFASMRLLDSSDADLIIAESLPMGGLGSAINDRLLRASTRL